ncbi:hypothetical protein LXM25_26665 [Dyadobacter sp. LJ53]|uniref:hypothetical protein n=1 Tax=Dyadobacter chenwenxiniae TaxID=2906456 RepID=UPI001F39932A|nr:hypothetical protein [Dyadobacter chenwenxiniae]MCF0053683.1 hypothetical protein [Dyadobacter chenwenxiniae]
MKKFILLFAFLVVVFTSCQEESDTILRQGTGAVKHGLLPSQDPIVAGDLTPEDPNGGGQGGPPNIPVPYPSALPWILSGKYNGGFSTGAGSQLDVYNTVIFGYNSDPTTPHPDPVGLKLRLAVVHEMPGNFAYWIRAYVMNIKNGVPIFLQDFPVTVNALSTNGGGNPFPQTRNGTMTVNNCTINSSGKLTFNCTVKYDGNVININKVNLVRIN